MNIAIRVDASNRIGFGHLIRCRTLAAALRDQGAEVRFVCRAHPGHGIAMLEAEGFAVAILSEPPAAEIADADYARWLGVAPFQDALETLAALGNWRTDWLIVDHYGLDRDWEQALRPHVGRILVIDDLANRRHDCALLLDQNHAMDAKHRYDGLLPAHASTLFGPRHALLRPEYAYYRRQSHARNGQVRRVLVFFGGTDSNNFTGRALTALNHPALAHLKVDLVVGANHAHRHALAEQAARHPGTVLHGPRPHLADLMSQADLAIGAGGTTTWERCCLGLPSLVVSIADNQRPACIALATDGFIQYLGDQEGVTVATLREAVLSLIADPVRRQALSKVGSELVDGKGVMRVIEVMQQRGRTSVVNDSAL